MYKVSLQSVPSQKIKTVLNNQIVNINVYQLRYGLYVDVYVDNTLVIGAVACKNLNRIIRSDYLNESVGFKGDFTFYDTHGVNDPTYDKLGSRYLLLYLTQEDLDAIQPIEGDPPAYIGGPSDYPDETYLLGVDGAFLTAPDGTYLLAGRPDSGGSGDGDNLTYLTRIDGTLLIRPDGTYFVRA